MMMSILVQVTGWQQLLTVAVQVLLLKTRVLVESCGEGSSFPLTGASSQTFSCSSVLCRSSIFLPVSRRSSRRLNP